MNRLIIKDNAVYSESERFLDETLFHNANGYLGIRGCLEEGAPDRADTMRGMYINGFYDVIPMKQAESLCNFVEQKDTMLNVADTQTIYLYADGEKFSIWEGNIIKNERVLNMEEGYTARDIIWKSNTGREIAIYIKRMASFEELSLFTIEYSVTPLNFDGEIELVSWHIPEVLNYSKTDDPRLASDNESHLNILKAYIEDEQSFAVSETKISKLRMCSAAGHILHADTDSEIKILQNANRIGYSAKIKAKKNQKITLEKYTIITDSIRNADFEDIAKAKLANAMKQGLGYYYNAQQQYLSEFWQDSQMEITGDEKMNRAVNFNMYQLLQSAARDSHCSIAAKGLSGEGYEGHYFWDTEMFMLPFFTLTNPALAKQLLTFRYDTLQAATDNAKLLGHKRGALYPWRTITGVECSGYFPSGTAQYHINGDIAYAVINYYLTTKDEEFIAKKGARIVFETARLWLEVGHFYEDRFVINDVTGPDEYTCLVNNNYYTNCAAKYNLEWAVKFYEIAERYGYAEEFSIGENELSDMKKAAKAMYLPYDEKLGINPQDDSFLSKPIWDIENTPKEDFPLLLHYHPLHLYRYQVCKQADTILAYFLFEHEQTADVMKRSFEYYEKITTHDSSLSTCVFSIVAARLGLTEKAYAYFGDSARLDLENLHDNTMHGIHTANMGGCYMAIVYGFAGLKINEDGVQLAPFLPESWQGYSFKFRYKDSLIKVAVTKDNTEIILEQGDSVEVCLYGNNMRVERNKAK